MDSVVKENNGGFQLTAFHLKLIAIVTMFIDHASMFFKYDTSVLMTCIGRLAFPIFAFQIVEGYVHTKDLKKYFQRLFIFAIISEIPFNLLVGFYGIFNPFAQNVLWTFIIGLIIIRLIDKFKSSTSNKVMLALKIVLVCALGYYVGDFAGVDYRGVGVLTVVLFYLTRNCKYKHIIQFIGCLILNSSLGGLYVDLNILGFAFSLQTQLLALISLIFIWLYKGKQGHRSKTWTYFCYWFYPAHILLLILIAFFIR